MEQYISKSALVAEIEKRIGNCAKQREDMLDVQCYTLADDASARIGELNCIKDFLDTLESKEVEESTAADRGMAEEIIINLKRVEQDYDKLWQFQRRILLINTE